MKRVFFLSLATIALSASSGSATAADSLVAWSPEQHLSQLGPLKLSAESAPSTLAMLKTFGKPTKRIRIYGNNTCEVTWKKLGMKVWMTSFAGARKHICKQKNAQLQQVVVNGTRWVTADKGLRVGDDSDRLFQLYPETELFPTNKGEAWSLSGSYYTPIGGNNTADVTARVKGGKVVAFVIWVGGAGE